MTHKEIVVLANSVKHGQHCVAGKCVNTGDWIRPVSNIHGAELSSEQAKYQNRYGKFLVKPLIKIKVKFSQHAPLLHQPENYLIDGSLWQQNYSIDEAQLINYLDKPIDLWGSGIRVEYSKIQFGICNIRQSLYLVQVECLSLSSPDGKRKATFNYNGINYCLPVTDPKFDEIAREKLTLKGILCVSLGESFQGYCYKLVATIF